MRKRIEAQHVDAGRLVVFHAAPLVEHVADMRHREVAPSAASVPESPRGADDDDQAAADRLLEAPRASCVAQAASCARHAKARAQGALARDGDRWRPRACANADPDPDPDPDSDPGQVSLETATVENLVQALQQPDGPMLHFLPTRDYDSGMSMESYEGELKALPVAQLAELLGAPRRAAPPSSSRARATVARSGQGLRARGRAVGRVPARLPARGGDVPLRAPVLSRAAHGRATAQGLCRSSAAPAHVWRARRWLSTAPRRLRAARERRGRRAPDRGAARRRDA